MTSPPPPAPQAHDGARQADRLKQALEAHVRFQLLWRRGATKTELEAAGQEAMRLTREAWQ